MSARIPRRRIQRANGEAGFTLVELVVTMAVMSIVATAMMAVAMRSFTTTNTITNRRDVLVDGRVAIDQMTKQLRQAESIDASSTESTLTFDSYIDGVAATIVWRVTGTSAPYVLEQSRDGGHTFAPLVSPLLCKTSADTGCADHPPFTQNPPGGPTDRITIDLTFETSTSTVDLISDVQLRNVESDDA